MNKIEKTNGNVPLSIEELRELPDGKIVYIETAPRPGERRGSVLPVFAVKTESESVESVAFYEAAPDEYFEGSTAEYNKWRTGWRIWGREPTDEETDAAPWDTAK